MKWLLGEVDDATVIDAFERCFCSDAEGCPGCYQDGPGFGYECRKSLCQDVLLLIKKLQNGSD